MIKGSHSGIGVLLALRIDILNVIFAVIFDEERSAPSVVGMIRLVFYLDVVVLRVGGGVSSCDVSSIPRISSD